MSMERFIENYKNEKFDVIVIGGGITGASVA
jgi:glycerol-3-phosphate dehydrogenase